MTDVDHYRELGFGRFWFAGRIQKIGYWIQNKLINRTLLEQLLLKLRVRDDALFDQYLRKCVCHSEG